MFKIDPVYESVKPNDGDPFVIVCSRRELLHLQDALELAVAHEANVIASDILTKIQERI